MEIKLNKANENIIELVDRLVNAKMNEELLESEFVYEQKNSISRIQKQEWLDKFYRRMSFALYKGFIMPPGAIIDSHSVNKLDYYLP